MFEYTKEIAAILVKALADVQIKQEDGQTVYKMIISKEITDRDGEIIKLDGIDFKNYLKNPVVLIDHSYRVESLVGKSLKIYVEGKNIISEFIFAEGTEAGDMAKQLYDAGFLKTASIGFIPIERDANNREIITKCELLEWSFVVVPCNPGALSLDGKTIEKAMELGLIKSEEIEINEVGGSDNEENDKEELNTDQIKQDIEGIKSDLSEIKTLLKGLADKNAEDQQKTDEMLEKKKTLQAIDNAVGEALKNFKLLKP